MLPFSTPADRRIVLRVALWLLAPLTFGFCAAILLVRHQGRSVWKLLSDPAAAIHVNPLLGVFSNIGILAWTTGAAIALFAACLLARARAPAERVHFHLGAGLFTTLLTLDDFFLIHDDLAQRYLGLHERVIYAAYALLFVVLVVRCRREILRHHPTLFLLACALLGFMATADAIDASDIRYVGLAMSGTKFLGIFTWTAWLAIAATRDLEAVRSDQVNMPQRPLPPPPPA